MSQFATLDEMAAEANAMGDHTPEYWAKQVHRVPKSRSVDRIDFLCKLASGKTILNIGCTGPLDVALSKVATRNYGLDRDPSTRTDYTSCDLDRVHETGLPALTGVELIICGEVLEHLSNPGYFLDALRRTYPAVPAVFTVPNAFARGAVGWLTTRGRENVNRDHVAYYSYTTLRELLRRAKYEIRVHYWYGGHPYVSEGLMALTRPLPKE